MLGEKSLPHVASPPDSISSASVSFCDGDVRSTSSLRQARRPASLLRHHACRPSSLPGLPSDAIFYFVLLVLIQPINDMELVGGEKKKAKVVYDRTKQLANLRVKAKKSAESLRKAVLWNLYSLI